MDGTPEQSSTLPAHNATRARNLLDDSQTSNPTTSLDTRASGQRNDPQYIFNDLFPPPSRRHGRPIGGSYGIDGDSELNDSSIVYLGHNVFETHKTFDFLYHSADKQAHSRRSTGSPSAYSDGAPDATSVLPPTDPATQFMMDSDIVRWATAIPDNLPLKLSVWAASLLGPAGRVPPSADYPVMAFLAIFENHERRLTDRGIVDAFMESFEWFRTHSELDGWKADVIKCMTFDTRFKVSYGVERSWTIDISEVHRHPFVRREARNRPMRLLPPGPKSQTQESYAPRFGTENREMGRARSISVPAGDATGTNARPTLQYPSLSTGSTSHGAPSGTSYNPSSSKQSHRTIPQVHRPVSPRRNVNSLGNLPSYSEILPTGDARDEQDPDFDNQVLPSIHEVLGPEMDLVTERGRTNES